jgi:putative heme-binding domain-containing protein
MMPRFWIGYVLLLTIATTPAHAAEQGSSTPAARALTKLLASGRLPPERRGAVVELICSRGGPDDLAAVLDRTVAGDYEPDVRRRVLELMIDAAVTRKVRPSGDLSLIEKIVHASTVDRDTRLAAVKLGSVWKVPALADELTAAALDDAGDPELRLAALDALATFGTPAAKATLAKLAVDAKHTPLRARAAVALAKLDLAAAAAAAAPALAAAQREDDVAPLLDAFLTRKGGPDRLAAALQETTLSADAAKLALRHMYSVGRSDAALSDVLTKAAGIGGDVKPPTPEELKQLIAEVAADGDAARGEKIFRRGDLSCMKCHAVSRAGGNVGPDLSAVGSISPVDYLINSIVDPNLAIKEQFVTRVIVTDDGETFTGIVVDRDDVRVNLKDAAGKVVTIPTADIDEEAEGRSLMPQGLTKFLTRAELVDLARFLSELGKPGPYAIRKTPTIQRWRVMKQPPQVVARDVPDTQRLKQYVLSASGDAWTPAYGMVGGSLPIGELAPPGHVVYLQGEIEVVQAGKATVSVTPLPGITWWIDERLSKGSQVTTNLSRGRHTITVRAVTSPEGMLTVEIQKPATDSTIEFDVVSGSE